MWRYVKIRFEAEPSITDHALLRWLERVHGIDIEFFRDQLAAEVRPFIQLGCCRAKANGVEYVFKGAALATVIKN